MWCFPGLKVGACIYYPAYNKKGHNVKQRIVISALTGHGEMKLTAWGKIADICAKSLSPGKEFHAMAEASALPRNSKAVLVLSRLTFGEDSPNLINYEVMCGRRPVDWCIPNTADHAEWRKQLQTRVDTEYDPKTHTLTFGYADVDPRTGFWVGPYNPKLALGKKENIIWVILKAIRRLI